MSSQPETSPQDAGFPKYAALGAYHWREVSGHWVHHHAFTAERYRHVLAALGPIDGSAVLDYGCGDGALAGWLVHRARPREIHGFDPNPLAVNLCRRMFAERGISGTVHATLEGVTDDRFDAVVCADVIEHVHDPLRLLREIARVLKPGGRAVITTPIRLTERPEDPAHVQEWFHDQFRELLQRGPLVLKTHEVRIPAAATEIYFWRPRFLLRAPVFRLLCNLLSIYFDVNALSYLAVRPKLFMVQIAVLEKPLASGAER